MKILHCFRAPLGGLFRHVLDLAQWQAGQGHEVGLVTGNLDEWPMAREKIAAISDQLSLGVNSFNISRLFSPNDFSNVYAIRKIVSKLDVDIVHGHGAKGGFYGRLGSIGNRAGAFYTPHGGSLHYSRDTLSGKIFLTIETALEKATSGIVFESDYARRTYAEKIGVPACEQRVIYNGLGDSEFEPVTCAPDSQYDIGFVGELRYLKGIDTLLQALASWPDGNRPRCVIAGAGRDADELKAMASTLGLDANVDFIGAQPARQVFAMAKLFALPSKAESLPYIVIEILAARTPAIVTDVGGISEIYGEGAGLLIAAEDAQLLAEELHRHLHNLSAFNESLQPVYNRVAEVFRVSNMARQVTDFYSSST